MPHEYENDEPVTCKWTILDLLHARWGDYTVRALYAWPDKPAHVEVWHEGSDHGRGEGTTLRYLVDSDVVTAMLSFGLLRHAPRWGGTHAHQLLISALGQGAIERKWEEVGGANFYGHDDHGVPPASLWLRRRT